jgi:molecular chaperone GrpE (heat shock protein)
VVLLRESDDEGTGRFTEAADKAWGGIAKVLRAHNIGLIKPKPKDMFDAKEHEVLTAEKHEGYKKGEIIKLINSGYRQNGEVLLRANVVAAR